MPRVRAGVLHDDGRSQRTSDVAAVDHPTGGLPTRSEERVGCATEEQAGCVGLLDQLAARLPIEGEGLLVPDVLAGGERGGGHFDVSGRNREVDDELDVGVSQ